MTQISEEARLLFNRLEASIDEDGTLPAVAIDVIQSFLTAARNAALEDAAHNADLRSRVFGGEPTTGNEYLLVRSIVDAIRDLKTNETL